MFFCLTELAFLIIERYEDLCSKYDEKGVSPLHLLASQPTAFRSGTYLGLIDKIIYHCKSTSLPSQNLIQPILSNHNIIKKPNSFVILQGTFVLPPGFGDAEKSDDPAERQTLVKLLPVLWNNIKGLLFLILTFIKICINPSGGEKAENARTALDEERPAQVIPQQRPASTPDQGNEHRILIIFVNIIHYKIMFFSTNSVMKYPHSTSFYRCS